MSVLKDEVISETLGMVTLVRMQRGIAKWWNARKKVGDLPVFCGWYWMRGGEERGPFHTRSAAIRDAYYSLVLKRETPSVADSFTVPEAQLSDATKDSSKKPKRKSAPLRRTDRKVKIVPNSTWRVN